MNPRALTLKYLVWCQGVKAAAQFIPDEAGEKVTRERYKPIFKGLVIGIIVCLIGYYFSKPSVEEGVVAAKSITGVRNNIAYTIIRFHELGANPKIDDWESLFPNTTKLSEYAESQLKNRYTDIRYVINIRRKPKTMGYLASKDDFNKVNPGDTVKFKILHKRDDIVRIIRVIG